MEHVSRSVMPKRAEVVEKPVENNITEEPVVKEKPSALAGMLSMFTPAKVVRTRFTPMSIRG